MANITIFLGASTPWYPWGPSRPVLGLFYLYLLRSSVCYTEYSFWSVRYFIASHVCLSFRTFFLVWKSVSTSEWIFVKFHISDFFVKFVDIFQFWLTFGITSLHKKIYVNLVSSCD